VLLAAQEWWAASSNTLPTPNEIKDWIFEASVSITEAAENEQLHPRAFACTLLGSMLTPSGAIYFQVGDGGIVVNEGGHFTPVFWPEETEALNLTFFITDETWSDHTQILVSPTCPGSIALFTDGLQLLVLDYANRTAHAPFFEQLFSQLESCSEEHLPYLDEAVAAYLNSDAINARTDDDKTLILAMRNPVTS